MTIERPNGLDCPRCGVLPHSLKRGSARVKGTDYYWRYMICEDCGEKMWWGSPSFADQPHLMMKVGPKLDDYGKTININLALPIPTTLKALASKASEVRIQKAIAVWMEYNNKTPQTLTPEDREELKRIMEANR